MTAIKNKIEFVLLLCRRSPLNVALIGSVMILCWLLSGISQKHKGIQKEIKRAQQNKPLKSLIEKQKKKKEEQKNKILSYLDHKRPVNVDLKANQMISRIHEHLAAFPDVQVKAIQVNPSEKTTFLEIVSMTLQFSGEWKNIAAFIYFLEQLKENTFVKDLKLENSDVYTDNVQGEVVLMGLYLRGKP